jgi:putative transcriptional regulator
LLNHKGYGTGTETIDKLCHYFGCSVDDLMEHLPEASAGAAAKDKSVGASLNGSARG